MVAFGRREAVVQKYRLGRGVSGHRWDDFARAFRNGVRRCSPSPGPVVTQAERRRAADLLAAFGATLVVADLLGGLVVFGGYTLELVALRVLAAAVAAALILRRAIGRRLDRSVSAAGPDPWVALLVGLELPGSLAGLTGRPWFAIVGLAAVPVLLASLALTTEFSAVRATAGRRAMPRRRKRLRRASATGAVAGRSHPQAETDLVVLRPRAVAQPAGWYPDPESRDRHVWRWWDGRTWTEHRSPGTVAS